MKMYKKKITKDEEEIIIDFEALEVCCAWTDYTKNRNNHDIV